MTNQEIFDLCDRFDRGTALYMKVTMGDSTLELDRRGAAAPVTAATAAPAPAPAKAEDALYIRSPLVGTFYAASAPDQPPFVKAGDTVKKGQTVCLLEAMKMMSEVAAPWDCVIEEIIAENGALAAYDAPLFRCRKV